MQWALDIPNTRPVTANEVRNSHWRKTQPYLAEFRRTAQVLARIHRIPKSDHITVRLMAYPPDKRRRDASNLMPTQKACVDGLVDAGIVPDDTAEFVTEEMPKILHDGQKRWRLVLLVEAA